MEKEPREGGNQRKSEMKGAWNMCASLGGFRNWIATCCLVITSGEILGKSFILSKTHASGVVKKDNFYLERFLYKLI